MYAARTGSDARGSVRGGIGPKNLRFTSYTCNEKELSRSGPGQLRGDDVEVLAGVSEGDTLVAKIPENLRDGQNVVIKQ